MVRFSLLVALVLALAAITSSKSICSLDLKQCEDGSFVGRDPKTCEFLACPTTQADSSSSGEDSPSPSCNKDLYMCPDGSFVGRGGKDCAFLPCQCVYDLKTCPDGSSVGKDPNTCQYLPCPSNNNNNNGDSSDDTKVCTADLFMCNDGSFVGRDPKTCEFLACPNVNDDDGSASDDPVCPQDLSMCPDGSFVGRDPKTCAFLPCKGQPNQPSDSSDDDSESSSSDEDVPIGEAIQSFPQSVNFAGYIYSVQTSTFEYVSTFYPWMKMKQHSHHSHHHDSAGRSPSDKEVILVYLSMYTPPQDLPRRYYSYPVFYVVQDTELNTCAFRPVMCPDGVYVALSGANCDYAACYIASSGVIPASSDCVEEDSGIVGIVLATLVFPLGIILLGMSVCYCRRRSSRVCRKATNWKGYSDDKASLLPQTSPSSSPSLPPTPFPVKKSTPTQQQPQQFQQPQVQQIPFSPVMNGPQIQPFMIPTPAYGMLPSFPALNPYFMPVDENGNYQFPMVYQPQAPVYPMYNQQGQQ
eukprot:TRINITY_DN24_c0_g1_i4.p1 TRINITY_DN24_c0_g1~~TRINITY_DN24_c0_g1_i4.p1  ORF type:complete len:524 (+),score=121.34 TRINITY_DN24_c0_g1_i4:119-1690(+)